jgi:NADPH:quinone reductase-like Zn-dependent oxidoreductase
LELSQRVQVGQGWSIGKHAKIVFLPCFVAIQKKTCMRQIIFSSANNVDLVTVPDHPTVPDTNHVIVDIHAFGVNFADLMAKQGIYPDAPPFPFVVGYEFAGVVSHLGDGVDPSWLNKEVYGLSKFGAYADRIHVPINQIFTKPTSITMVEAAAIPVVYLTAYFGLITIAGMKKGETLLIQNVGGGLGLAALDLALHAGVTVIGTASARKHDMLMQRGLHHVIDYTKEDFFKKVMEITGGKGVDVILDPMGPGHWQQDYKLLALGGRLVMCGVSQLTEGTNWFSKILGLIKFGWQLPWYNPIKLMNDNKSVSGINLGRAFGLVDTIGPQIFAELTRGVEEGWIKPRVDSEWPMDKIKEAHARLEQRQNMGKVVIVTGRTFY